MGPFACCLGFETLGGPAPPPKGVRNAIFGEDAPPIFQDSARYLDSSNPQRSPMRCFVVAHGFTLIHWNDLRRCLWL